MNYNDHWSDVQSRMNGYWEREAMDRCCIAMMVKKRDYQDRASNHFYYDTVKATDENFKDKYIGAGKMVHWADVEEHKENSTVILKALMIDKNEIPKVYHYVVIAWYDKVATSGLDQAKMDVFQDALFTHLRSINVTEEDLNSIVIRGYTGNVGTTCGQIMEDDDVDLMFGWSSIDNVTSTGGMDPKSLLETITEYKVGEKNRTIHRLSDKETAITVLDWMKSDACRNLFA